MSRPGSLKLMSTSVSSMLPLRSSVLAGPPVESTKRQRRKPPRARRRTAGIVRFLLMA
jgi:hypothetical protein